MEFSFATAADIRFGVGRAREVAGAAAALGDRPLLVTGRHPDRHAQALVGLTPVAHVQVGDEPTMDDARSGISAALKAGVDVLVAVGGGSVIDLAKAIAVLVSNGGDPLDYAEVIGEGQPLLPRSLPVVAVPTTAGTGSEVTSNAVLASRDDQVKVSLRSPVMLPRVAIVDPELTLSCPASVTMSSGLDALTQCLEPYTSRFANPLTDGFALEGMQRAGRSLEVVAIDGDHLEARIDMSLCSLLGGLSLANAKLGAVHGFAGPLGGMMGAPHGAICGALLPATVATNIAALRGRDPDNPALSKYTRAAEVLCDAPVAEAIEEWVLEMVRVLDVPGLGELGLTRDRIDEACEKAARASSMKGNPIELTDDELHFICEASM